MTEHDQVVTTLGGDAGNDNVHSADVRVFDRNGVWVSTLNVGADLSVANLLRDIRAALRAKHHQSASSSGWWSG